MSVSQTSSNHRVGSRFNFQLSFAHTQLVTECKETSLAQCPQVTSPVRHSTRAPVEEVSPTGAHGETAVPDVCPDTSPAPHIGHTGARNAGPGPAWPPIRPRPHHCHDPKPLQFHRGLDQTFQEYESPLEYSDSFTTPKCLMGFIFFNPQPLSHCMRSCDEPTKNELDSLQVLGLDSMKTSRAQVFAGLEPQILTSQPAQR